MDNGAADALELQRMPDGGFLVLDGRRERDLGYYRGPCFASTSIDEALGYMRDKIKPIPPTQNKAG
jgi:hypothetical protein